jgi:hypothetical protein
MSEVSSRLLELVPGTEPPLGFDRRVLARVGVPASEGGALRRFARRRPRVMLSAAAAAAALAIVFGSIGWMAGHDSNPRSHPVLAASFLQGGHSVGEVVADWGNPPWLSMTLQGVQGADWLTCEVVQKNGKVIKLGDFAVVGGRASWGVPDTSGLTNIKAVRLLDYSGRVVATAVVR